MKVAQLSLLIALALGWAIAPALGENTDGVSVTISYIDCVQNLGAPSQPTITASDFSGRDVLSETLPLLPHTVIRQIIVRLPPGFYGLGIRNGLCASSLDLTILPNHPRSLAIIGDTLFHMANPTAMLSGTLPSVGWRVAIVYPDRAAARGLGTDSDGHLEVVAVVEGDAYYATSLSQGRVMVRLYNQARDQCLDFYAGVIDPRPGKRTSAIIRNITLDELALAVKSRNTTLCIGLAPHR